MEETLDDIGARLETSQRKSRKRLVWDVGVLRTSAEGQKIVETAII
jgi:hypothetical protein